MTLSICPLASPLKTPDAVRELVQPLVDSLTDEGLPCEVVEAAAATRAAAPVALLIATGGTEKQALTLVDELGPQDRPVIMLAHPFENSLPACMEILARLIQEGRRGTIVLLNGRPQGPEQLRGLLAADKTRTIMTKARLGVVGEPSDWLVASVPSAEVVRQRWGPTLCPLPLSEVIQETERTDDADANGVLREVTQGASRVEPHPADLRLAAKVALATRRVAQRHRLHALTMRCFDLVTNLKTTGCLALSGLLDSGFIAGCEGDISSTLTMMWLYHLTGELPFQANPQDIDGQDLWLAHCTISRRLVESYELKTHFESSLGVAIAGQVQPQPVTMARIGGAQLDQVFLAEGQIVAQQDSPRRCRTQLKLTMDRDLSRLLTHPLGNHHVVIRGHWATQLSQYQKLHGAA